MKEPKPRSQRRPRASALAAIPEEQAFAEIVEMIQASRTRALLVVRSRQVRVAGIARTDRVCLAPGTERWPRVQASLGIDRRGNPPRPAITNQLAPPTRRPIVFRPHHRLTPSHPSVEDTRKEEGENPRDQIGA